jgi:Holliday junction resolvase RusA-like endonuclease
MAFEGPVALQVFFDYQKLETRIVIMSVKYRPHEYEPAAKKGSGARARPDLDNLVKQVMEAAELAGIVSNDVQFVSVYAEKLG